MTNQAPSLRLLFADDEEINRLVAEALLNPLELVVRFAEDGQQAVRLAADNHFDIIVLDIHMPVLGGLEAANQIQRQYRRLGLSTRLVACSTAEHRGDVLADPRSPFEAFLCKPYSLDDARRALFGEPADESALSADQAQAPAPAPAPAPAGPWVDRVAFMDRFDDEALHRKLLGIFVNTAEEAFAQVRQAVESAESGQVKAKAHRLKGMAIGISAPSLAETSRRMELAAHKGDVTEAERSLKELQQRLQATLDEARRLCDS
jgi:two-component system sensor histidine kinase/response regulator